MTSKPLVSRTFATFRSAEFGFFGVVVYTRVHTPRFCGQPSRAGTLLRFAFGSRPCAMSWLIVGMTAFLELPVCPATAKAGPPASARPEARQQAIRQTPA